MARRKKKKPFGASGGSGGSGVRGGTSTSGETVSAGQRWDPMIVGGALFLLGAGYFFWAMPVRGLILLAAAGGCVFAAFRRRS